MTHRSLSELFSQFSKHKRPKVYHLHSPKTGGTTCNHFFASLYPPGRSLYGSQMRKIREDLQKKKKWNGLDAYLKSDGYDQFDYIGIHANILNMLPEDHGYMLLTILRDPLERVVSHFYDWNRLDDTCLALDLGEGRQEKERARTISCAEFIETTTHRSGRRNFHNSLCKSLIPGYAWNPNIEESDVSLYERARGVLDQFDVVFFTEHLSESLRRFSKTYYGKPMWRNVPKKNVNKKREESFRALSIKDQKIVRKYNQADIMLYEYAKNRFD